MPKENMDDSQYDYRFRFAWKWIRRLVKHDFDNAKPLSEEWHYANRLIGAMQEYEKLYGLPDVMSEATSTNDTGEGQHE